MDKIIENCEGKPIEHSLGVAGPKCVLGGLALLGSCSYIDEPMSDELFEHTVYSFKSTQEVRQIRSD